MSYVNSYCVFLLTLFLTLLAHFYLTLHGIMVNFELESIIFAKTSIISTQISQISTCAVGNYVFNSLQLSYIINHSVRILSVLIAILTLAFGIIGRIAHAGAVFILRYS